VIEFRAEVSPEQRPVTGTPPSRQRQAHHVKHAQNRSHADKDSENQTDPDEELHNTYQISKKDSMGEYDVAENGPIEADGRLPNVAFEIVRESGMSKRASEDFVLAEKNEEDSRTNPGNEQCFG